MFEFMLWLNISVYSHINISSHLHRRRLRVLLGNIMAVLTEALTPLNNVIIRYKYFVSLNIL
jgi:hypothetical protein